MPSSAVELLDDLERSAKAELPPWGLMRSLGSRAFNVSVKYLVVEDGHRTSQQRHNRKDELLFILGGGGHVTLWGEEAPTRHKTAPRTNHKGAGTVVRIPPYTVHQVTGPLTYLEVSTYDDGTDTVRLNDDYGRRT